MLEKLYNFEKTDQKIIEKIIADENVNINHMVLPKGEGLPEHYSNSTVYMLVVRGNISLRLGDQDEHTYPKGSIINIPNNTKMNVYNDTCGLAEIFVIKAPAPSSE